METRGAVAEVDPETGEITFHASTQSIHQLKWVLAMLGHKRSFAGTVLVFRQLSCPSCATAMLTEVVPVG